MARLTNEEYVEIYDSIHGRGVVRACIDLLIISPDAEFSVLPSKGTLPTFAFKGSVALVKRDILPELHHWHIPGGRVDQGETSQMFADRVTPKDLGVQVEIIGPVGGINVPGERSKLPYKGDMVDVNIHSFTTLYLCRALSHDIRGSKEGHEVGWFSEVPVPSVGFQMSVLKGLGFLS